MSLIFRLFLTFLQIGVLAFGGGYAALPLLQSTIVEKQGWLTMPEMMDVVSISQMTPGPIAINSATFVGTKIAGLPGSIVATLGVVLPQFILMMILGHFIFSGRKISFLDKMLKGLRPGIVGLIGIAAISMFTSSVFGGQAISFSNINIVATICFIVGFILYIRKVDIIKLIIIGAVLGIGLNMIIY